MQSQYTLSWLCHNTRTSCTTSQLSHYHRLIRPGMTQYHVISRPTMSSKSSRATSKRRQALKLKMDIRQATIDDLLGMQNANLLNLPENYTFKYYLYHALTWPELSYVAVDPRGRIVGYILAKMEDEPKEDEPPSGHVTSISVLRPYRRLGLANKLMKQSQEAMVAHYDAAHITLHVRKSNRAAISLYRDTLGFEVHGMEKSYYADGEDAYGMRFLFKKEEKA